MDPRSSTTNHEGSPEGRAALIALARTLGIDPAALKAILELAFSLVQRGMIPGLALQTTFFRLGYRFDVIKFHGVLEAFRRAFAGMFAQDHGETTAFFFSNGKTR